MIRLSDDLRLPVESVTQTFAILGIRGSGKTNTGVVLAEELLHARQQVVVIDPVDVWWGLKSGFAVPVIGGDHADVPLEGASGVILADFVVDSNSSVILSLRHLSMNDQRRFAGDFAKRLYERKGQQRSPLMLIVDEADEFVPQRLPHGHETMFGAFDRLVRRGRASGIGVTLISQRAQVVNKDVLSQVETLIGMRVLHKLDRKALDAWIEAHDTEGKRDEFLQSLASLGRGDAWVWSPSWLNVFQRVHVRARKTYDSSATPEAGHKQAVPKNLEPVDLERLRAQMRGTIERAKADDPRELRSQIVALREQLRGKAAVDTGRADAIAAAEESVRRKEHKVNVEKWTRIRRALDTLLAEVEKVLGSLGGTEAPSGPPITLDAEAYRTLRDARVLATRQHVPSSVESDGNLSGPCQRILNACAWMASIGVMTPKQTAVAFLAGYTAGGGAFNNPRGWLHQRGLIEYCSDSRMGLTSDGRRLAKTPDSALTTEELQERVLNRLPGPEQRILHVLLAAYPDALDNAECAAQAGYADGGGAYNNPRGRLRSLELIEYPGPGQVRAADLLFL